MIARQSSSKITTEKAPSAEEVARRIREAGERAAAEAEKRRAMEAKAAEERAAALPKEVNGPKGPEPTRYGDWEKKGIASDF